MTLTPDQLSELRRLCESATTPKWNALSIELMLSRVAGGFRTNNKNDAAFIAAARNSLPALLDLVESLNQRLGVAVECLDRVQAVFANSYDATGRPDMKVQRDYIREALKQIRTLVVGGKGEGA